MSGILLPPFCLTQNRFCIDAAMYIRIIIFRIRPHQRFIFERWTTCAKPDRETCRNYNRMLQYTRAFIIQCV